MAFTVIYIALSFARLGFNITDEGLVLDWGYRILHGAVPHRDFITPIPVGSGLIHLLDFASPIPLFITSRLIAIAELVAYSTLLVALVLGTPWRRWGAPQVLAVLAASLIDLHVFPVMAWYTIDGLALTALGAWLLMRSSTRPPGLRAAAVAMTMLGAAALTKQSFWPAIPIGLLTVAIRARPQPLRQAAWLLVVSVAAALSPLLLYVTWIGAGGGIKQLAQQIVGARPVTGIELLADFASFPLIAVWAALLFLAAAVFRELRYAEVALARSGQRPGRRVVAAVFTGTLLVVATVVAGRFSRDYPWGSELQWVLVVSLVSDTLRGRPGRQQAVGAWILALSQMVRLSYGWANPDLVAGVMVVYLITRIWTSPATEAAAAGHRCLTRFPARPAVVCGLLAVAIAGFSYYCRTNDVYHDARASALTADLGQIAGIYGGVRTGSSTLTYERELSACLRQYPADRVSVVPDTPSAPVAFRLTPLMPISLVEPNTYHGNQEALIRLLQSNARQGSYLLLIQTWLGPPQELRHAHGDSLVILYNDPVFASRMYGNLDGRRITCGSFVGIYHPQP